MSTDTTFTAESNPADFNSGPVETYLETASREEVQRVLDLETGEGGKDRVGVKDAATVRLNALDAELADEDDQEEEKAGLAATGNPHDMATPSEGNVSANIAHQEGAPEELTKVADKAAEQGYLGETPDKPDYSQANPAVINQEG